MKIGSIDLPVGGGLAPMAGVTDMPFRTICHRLGAAWSVSEMLSAKGYCLSPEDLRAHRELLARSADEGISALQLFGHEPERMAQAAMRLEDRGFAFLDINFGCPAHKIVSGGDGSALLKRPELVGEIVTRVVRAVRCPVTVKIRAGWDERSVNAVEIARICEDAGAAAITVHARTREQFYAGHADWSVIRDVVEAVSIPVIGNGDIENGADAVRMLRQTGCALVAVGRAARGNPWIFEDIRCAMTGDAYVPVSFAQRVRLAIEHLEMEIAFRGETSAVLEMRKHMAWYLSGVPGCAKLRGYIQALTSAQAVRDALLRLL